MDFLALPVSDVRHLPVYKAQSDQVGILGAFIRLYFQPLCVRSCRRHAVKIIVEECRGRCSRALGVPFTSLQDTSLCFIRVRIIDAALKVVAGEIWSVQVSPFNWPGKVSLLKFNPLGDSSLLFFFFSFGNFIRRLTPAVNHAVVLTAKFLMIICVGFFLFSCFQ